MSLAKTQDWLESYRSRVESTHLSELPKQQTKTRVISVASGKGGVGKTTVALKFALELAQNNKRVLLVDCDFNLSNTVIKLGLPINRDFLCLLSAQKDFEQCLIKHEGLHILPACNGEFDLVEKKFDYSQIIIDIIRSHNSSYDFIVLDCPAGLLKSTLTLNAYSDDRFIVATPDKSSITDSYSLIKILRQKYGIRKNHLVVNKVASLKQYQKVVNTMSETAENFLDCRTHILGGIKIFTGQSESFDRALVKNLDKIISKNFIQIIKNYTDTIDGSDGVLFQEAKLHEFGQEVQI